MKGLGFRVEGLGFRVKGSQRNQVFWGFRASSTGLGDVHSYTYPQKSLLGGSGEFAQ